MAAELAQEIIHQSNSYPDQPTPFALRIPTEIHPGYFEHVTITSPSKNGRQVLSIQFPTSQGATSLLYSATDNLDGAVFCLTSFMLYGDGCCKIEMKPVNLRTGMVDEQFTLATWDLNPVPHNMRSRPSREWLQHLQEDVYQQVKKIVMMLFCESGGDVVDVADKNDNAGG
mmetsp:Transcript_31570/g.57786  ORF Transcript_31570/g.57786 Transcript_31570/m.57786 type:complete len:171 (+) Transcript_31570:140-652(+)|eukprot:CAMPEP_0201640478 /NCGR_PEP_ID=MMETSP0493-20130528/21952_1 /ASSEMBLY_ACC=CAM_ASM_000838 /TAXON_ID=420259 /ORGANISM="Thalassiosira gravida, Strain GMp14c1" /LENGTH=170 /DNA_ID=CAMNT_0048114181 /DNA_START=44 /DNA_END=556 /DNA_ORIENTATION=+